MYSIHLFCVRWFFCNRFVFQMICIDWVLDFLIFDCFWKHFTNFLISHFLHRILIMWNFRSEEILIRILCKVRTIKCSPYVYSCMIGILCKVTTIKCLVYIFICMFEVSVNSNLLNFPPSSVIVKISEICTIPDNLHFNYKGL